MVTSPHLCRSKTDFRFSQSSVVASSQTMGSPGSSATRRLESPLFAPFRLRFSSVRTLLEPTSPSSDTACRTGQDVIALLREQLATKTGEIVEARDRISLLEQGQASQARNLLEIEQVRKASSAREEELQQKRLEMEKRLDEVLLKSREREEALEEELRSTRKVAEDVRLSLTSVEASNSSLITS